MNGAIGIQLRKEARALLPWWVCVAVATSGIALLTGQQAGYPRFLRDFEVFVVMVHALGVLALASLSIGHELTSGTLPGLLVQPIDRRRLLLLKLSVLIPAVIALGAIVDGVFETQYLSIRTGARPLLIWGSVAVAIGLVPLLTMLTRKPLGGVVFAIVIPGLVFSASEWRYPLEDGTYAWSLTLYGTLVASAIGLVALFRLFSTLQVAGDGTARSWSRPAASMEHRVSAPRHWLWLLIRKEFRLQYLTLSVSALYVLGAGLILVAQYQNPDYMGPTFYAVTSLHAGFVALLVGAMSSAEERQLGTLASQVLLPRGTSRQWMVKAGVALALTAALTAGLPALLMAIHRPPDAIRIEEEFVAGMLLLTCGAMYVSSLASNSLWALLASLPAIGLGLALTNGMLRPVRSAVWRWLPIDGQRVNEVLKAEYRTDAWAARSEQLQWIYWLQNEAVAWVIAGIALLALYFAARNHRSLERNLRTTATQVAALLLAFWTATVACLVIAQMSYNAIR